MIELQYKQAGRIARRSSFTLGGFELEAPHSHDFPVTGKVIIGQLSKQFRLTIPRDGMCKVPDTQHNRDALKKKFEEKNGKKYFVFDVLSNIDLNEEAVHAGGGTISQTEERDLKKRIAELEETNAKLLEDVKNKKTGGKANTGNKPKTETGEGEGGKPPKKPVTVGEGIPDLA